MAQKFKIGDVVTLSSDESLDKWRPRFDNQTVTVTHYTSGQTNPYHLSNGLVAKPSELVAVTTTVSEEVKTEEEVEEFDTSEFPKPSEKIAPIHTINYFASAVELTGLKIGDKVRFDFLPNGETSRQLGGTSTIYNWLSNERYSRNLSSFIGKEAIVTQVNVYDGYIYFYEEGENLEAYPTIGLSIIERGVIVANFQASEERNALVTSNCVIIDEVNFSFDFFDKLWKYIKEHQKTPKSGYERNYDISKKHGRGVLHDNHIKVGCQQFKYKDVKRLMAAIRVARSL